MSDKLILFELLQQWIDKSKGNFDLLRYVPPTRLAAPVKYFEHQVLNFALGQATGAESVWFGGKPIPVSIDIVVSGRTLRGYFGCQRVRPGGIATRRNPF